MIKYIPYAELYNIFFVNIRGYIKPDQAQKSMWLVYDIYSP